MTSIDVWLNAFQASHLRLESKPLPEIESQSALLERAMVDVLAAIDGFIEPLSVDLALGESLEEEPALRLHTAAATLLSANARVAVGPPGVHLESCRADPDVTIVERMDREELRRWARDSWERARSRVPGGRVGFQELELATWRVRLPSAVHLSDASTVVARGGQIGEGDHRHSVERRERASWVSGSRSFFAMGLRVANAYGALQLDIDPRWSWWSGMDSFGRPVEDAASLEGRRTLASVLDVLHARGWTSTSA